MFFTIQRAQLAPTFLFTSQTECEVIWKIRFHFNKANTIELELPLSNKSTLVYYFVVKKINHLNYLNKCKIIIQINTELCKTIIQIKPFQLLNN